MSVASNKLSPQDTKSRIQDAAEALFIAGGYESLSMRHITSEAGVNLAAANYHFGSKDALIQSVLARKLDPLNEQRLLMLDAFEAQHGDHLACEHVLVALFLPAVRLFRGDDESGTYLQFLGRAYTDPSALVRDFITTNYLGTLGRFFLAFQKTLPDLSRQDLGFRLNFAMGALSGVLAGGNTQRLIRDFMQGEGDEIHLLSRLSALMVAALRAPLPRLGEDSLFSDIIQGAPVFSGVAKA